MPSTKKADLFPGLLRPGKWLADETHSPVATVEKRGEVPQYTVPKVVIGDDLLQRARANIMVDQDWAQTNGSPIHDGLMEMALAHYGDTIHIPVKRAWDEYDWKSTEQPKTPVARAARAAQLFNTYGDGPTELRDYLRTTYDALPARARTLLGDADRRLQRDINLGNFDQIARHIAEYEDALNKTLMEEEKPPEPSMGKARAEALTKEYEEEAERERAKEEGKNPTIKGETPQLAPGHYTNSMGQAKKVHVHRHLDLQHHVRTIGANWRPSHHGPRMRSVNRLYQDGKILSKHSPGGSVIFDGSGSMNWDYDSLQALSDKVPNLWAGIYTAISTYDDTGHGMSETDGMLCIFAENGRIGQYQHHEWYCGGQGGMDAIGPLMMTQMGPPPYVFVTDRGFIEMDGNTGRERIMPGHEYGPAGAAFEAQLNKVFADNKIVIVPDIDAAIAYLQGKMVTGWIDARGDDRQIRRK